MFDQNRVVGNRRIEIRACNRTFVACLRVVVFEPENPFPGWGRRSPLAQGTLDLGDRSEIAIDPGKVSNARIGWMCVRIDEARDHGPPCKIDACGPGRREGEDLLVGAYVQEAVAPDGNGACSWARGID